MEETMERTFGQPEPWSPPPAPMTPPAPGAPAPPKSLAALHALALGDRDRVEVEIGGMEPQTVVEDDQSAREEELGHERDLAGVDGNDGRSLRSRIVAAGVW